MSLLKKFQENIKSQSLFATKDKLLLAVSGGVDSVVLCELCKQSGYEFVIAHCNFQLRGEESERDEQFVKKLGEKYKTEVEVKRFETEAYAAERKISIQEAARDLRYKWFFDLFMEKFYSVDEPGETESPSVPGWHVPNRKLYLLTAHHADDNIETVAMNFFRGTGLHGLTGIPVSGSYLTLNFIRRPLLAFTKEELIRFASDHKLDYVEDSSNQSSKYTRNYFRNEIIPAISKIYPQVKENLLDNINRFREIENLYKLSVGHIKNKLCKKKGDETHIPIKQLLGYNNRALIYEIISDFGFSEKQIEEVIKLADGDTGSYISSGDYRIIKHRHWFIITSIASGLAENIIIEEKNTRVVYSDGVLELRKSSSQQPTTSNRTACLDAQEISFPLLLRKWKTGDYFYPLGMKKKKKLSRFFIDLKLSKTAKEKIWVIEMNKKILWVVGHRIDERFKITPATKNVLQMTFAQR
jgi:tRNA(Ile)-lysidine synthase